MKLATTCIRASIPGVGLTTFEDRQGSPIVRKLPYDVVYTDFRLTFINTDNHYERNVFDLWMGLIYDHNTNSFEYAEKYYSTIEVYQLDNTLSPIKKVTLYEVYPTNIGDIELSYDSGDTFEQFDVEFAYTYWKAENL